MKTFLIAWIVINGLVLAVAVLAAIAKEMRSRPASSDSRPVNNPRIRGGAV